jgi:hypothetical protein
VSGCKREFIEVLRLMEVFDQELVAQAAKDAIRLGTHDQAANPLPYQTASAPARSQRLSLCSGRIRVRTSHIRRQPFHKGVEGPPLCLPGEEPIDELLPWNWGKPEGVVQAA